MYKILLLPQQIMPGYFTSGSYIRLIHPFEVLAHRIDNIQIETKESYDDTQYNAVVVERIFREDVDADEIYQLIHRLKNHGSKLIYAIDDDYYGYFIEKKSSADSLRQLSVVCLLARKADAVICSTEALAATMRAFNRNVHVFPNFLSRRYLDKAPIRVNRRPKKDGTIHIGYMGTLTHLDDFRIAANALKAVMNDYANVKLHLVQIGDKDKLTEVMQPYEVTIHKAPNLSCLYDVFFPWYLKNFRWDIGLAPLANTSLNRGKSDLKLLDYAAIGAAGIYSRITPYADIKKNGMGIVVENTDEDWYAGIKKLIDDAELRSKIQQSSQKYLMQERVLEDNVGTLDQIIKQITSG